MRIEDFTNWLTYHGIAFPNFASWVKDLPDSKATIGWWARQVPDSITVDLLREASDAMAGGPTVYREQHFRTAIAKAIEIREAAHRERSYAVTSGQESVRCWTCQDTGRASVIKFGELREKIIASYGLERVQEIEKKSRYGWQPPHWATVSVPCKCVGGQLAGLVVIEPHRSGDEPATPEQWQALRDSVVKISEGWKADAPAYKNNPKVPF